MNTMPNKARQNGFVSVLMLAVFLVVAVVLIGFFSYINSKQYSPLNSPTPQSSLSGFPNSEIKIGQISETYTDTKNGFTLKYPKGWMKSFEKGSNENVNFEEPSKPECLPPNSCEGGGTGIYISILSNTEKLSLKEFIENMWKQSGYPGMSKNYIKSSNDLGINAEWLINRQEPGQGPGEKVYVKLKENKIISIYFGNMGDSDVDSVLSTFRIIK